MLIKKYIAVVVFILMRDFHWLYRFVYVQAHYFHHEHCTFINAMYALYRSISVVGVQVSREAR